jgi:hypothetical protein
MPVQQTNKFRAEYFVNEHDAVLRQASQICEYLQDQLHMLGLYLQDIQSDATSTDYLVNWKTGLKEMFQPFSDFVKDHVERETAFMDAFAGRMLGTEALKRNEAVIEHLDELIWLLDNTPFQKISTLQDYFAQKINEICLAVSEHCRTADKILGLILEVSQKSSITGNTEA